MAGQSGGTLVIGLGNPILSDDGVGWQVAEQVRQALEGQRRNGSSLTHDSVHVTEACVGGLSLAEMLIGYERAVIVDAIMTGNVPPGTVHELKLGDLPGTLNMASAHDTNLVTALRALRRYGARVPSDENIDIIAVEAQDVWTFREGCTPEVQGGLAEAVALVLRLVWA
ncbi:MAG: hydrogenase maturation protease [Anaerolineae bacterium]|nr:hydrogenase maturation protease [Anaerolineae bacterium]